MSDPCDPLWSRRDTLRAGLLGSVGLALPLGFQRSALAAAAGSARGDRILVVVEQTGGNDGLNTVVPYRSDAYYRARPTIAIPRAQVLALDDDIGLHPSLVGLRKVWDAGQLAIVQGCGYPNPERSHFKSMEYWHTATPHVPEPDGWVGRFADARWPASEQNLIVNLAERQSFAVESRLHAPIVFQDPDRFVRAAGADQAPVYASLLERDDAEGRSELAFLRQISRTAARSSGRVREAIEAYSTPISYGSQSQAASLATDLRNVAALIEAGFETRLFYVNMSGFDTHVSQVQNQRPLLMYVGDALEAFLKDLRRIGRAGDVAVMMFTEFGRRVDENRSGGTDHGTATPVYVLGETVRGGLYGEYPSLERLDANGDLVMSVDFRRVYATLIERWMGHADSESILRGRYEPFDLFQATLAT